MIDNVVFIVPIDEQHMKENTVGVYTIEGKMMFFDKDKFKGNMFYCPKVFAELFYNQFTCMLASDDSIYLYQDLRTNKYVAFDGPVGELIDSYRLVKIYE